MSNPRRMPVPPQPQGQVVATFSEYDSAVAYVENLIEKDFPPGAIAIVGNELRSVERVRGRLSYATVAARGAINGAWLGFLMGIVFMPNMLTSVQGTITMALFGCGIGILFNVIRFSMARRKRAFVSTAQFVAKEYQVQVPSELAAQAMQASGN